MASRFMSSASVLRGCIPAPAVTVRRAGVGCRCFASHVEPPNVAQLCQKARLTLTPEEIEDFGPKIGRIVDWFAQLQDVNLENVSPAIRVGEIEGAHTLRPDTPHVFSNREAMLSGVPDMEGPYLKVPKVLKENVE